MNRPEEFRHRQKAVVFVALLLFNMTLLVLQLWLFVSVLENIISGRTVMAIPAAVVSIVCLAINLWMLAGIYRMERRS